MKLCLAPDCSHRAATGHPAEYRDDVDICSDCGAALVTGDLTDHTRKPPLPFPPPWGRVVAGLVLLGITFALGFLPLPGLTEGMDAMWEGSWFLQHHGFFSVVAMGIMPFLSSLAIVEQGHALWWWIRGRRHLPRPRHRGWWWTVLGLALVLAAFQAWGIDLHLRSLSYQYWRFEPVQLGALWTILRIGSMVLGTAALVGIAALLGRLALGHGIALLLGFSALLGVIRDATHAFRFISAGQLVALAAILAGSVAGLVYLRRRRPTVAAGGLSWRLNPLAGGLVPVIIIPMLLLLPSTIVGLLHLPVPRWLYPGSHGYLALSLVTVVVFGALYVGLTWRPRHRLGLLIAHGVVAPDSPEAEEVLGQLGRARNRGGALTIVASVAVVLLGHALTRFAPLMGAGFHPILLLSLLTWDLRGEWLGRRLHGTLRTLTTTQDYEEATLLEARLEAVGVPCVIRNEHLRSIATFAGPHLPLAIQVPEEAPVPPDVRAHVSGAIL